ncbi:MAG: keratin [Zoogloea sp.]|nr:keratin [Zoogloea sp.]
MKYLQRREPSTRRLTQPEYILAVQHDSRRMLRRGFAVLAVLGALALAVWLVLAVSGPYAQAAKLEAEVGSLRQEAEQYRLQYEMEHATRTQLEEQMSGLTRQLKQVNDELQFFKRGHSSAR